MLLTTLCFWEATTKTFDIPCGVFIPTIFDRVAISCLSRTKKSYEQSRPTRTTTDFTFSDGVFDAFIEDHCGSTDTIDAYEHILFLTYWLNRYIFYVYERHIMKMFVPLATQLHEQQKVYLSKLVLCSLYESLGVTSYNLINWAYLDNLLIDGPIWLLQLWHNSIFTPALHIENPSGMVVGAEGARLAHITLDDGETVLQNSFEKYFSMFFKHRTICPY